MPTWRSSKRGTDGGRVNRLLSITANLGDSKTTLTHPASTTHARITPEQRTATGITEGLLRIAVGLEAVVDLQDDLNAAYP